MGNPPGIFQSLRSRAWRAAEIPAANSHTTARAAARMYAALAQGGELDGVRLLSHRRSSNAPPSSVPTASRRRWAGKCGSASASSSTGHPASAPNLRAFGHAGYGGSVGFADPDARIGFGYTPNQYLAGLGDDPRRTRILGALYGAL